MKNLNSMNLEDVPDNLLSEDEIRDLIEGFESNISTMKEASEYTGQMSSTAMYLYDIAKTTPITQEEKENIIRVMRTINKMDPRYMELRNILVQSDLKLVASIAFKNTGYGVDLTDLISEGTIGLIKAIEKYSPDKGCSLTTYAYSWIKLAIDIAIQKTGKAITVPMWIKVHLAKIYREECKLAQAKGVDHSDITDEEIAAALSMDIAEIRDLREIRSRGNVLSIEELSDSDDEDKKKFEAPDKTPLVNEMIANDERRNAIEAIIDTLPKEKYREVIKMRYGFTTGEEMSCAEIGRYYKSLGCTRGITRESVRQIEEKALAILRTDEYKEKITKAMEY